MKFKKGLTLCLFLAAFTGTAPGQSQSHRADLLGTVRDAAGAVMAGVSVTATQSSTGMRRSVLSDRQGSYRILALPAGEYELRAEVSGFIPTVYSGVRLTVGQYATVDFELQTPGLVISVEVEARTRMVEREKVVQASTIETEEIDNLPINGREFLDFALLTPGVSGNNRLDNSTPVNTPTTGLSFAGQDQRSNYVTVDGVENMDASVQTSRLALSQEAVQEFQISRSNFSAEFGRSRGGVVNIVSKSGGNEFRGSAFVFLRNEALDARNTFAFGENRGPIDPEFRRYQWGVAAGGPIVRDKTFLFTAYEGLARRESVFVTFLDDLSIFQTTPSQNELFQFLSSTGDAGDAQVASLFGDPTTGLLNTTPQTFPQTLSLLERESGIFPFETDSTVFSVKLDHATSDKNSLFVRFNFSDRVNENAEFGALKGVSNGVTLDSQEYATVISDTYLFSPTTVADFKFQHSFRRFEVPTNDPLGPELLISGVAQLGRDFTNPTGYDLTGYQWIHNLSMQRGNHTLKLGVDANRVRVDGFAEIFLGGQFAFAEAIPFGIVMDAVLGPDASTALTNRLVSDPESGGLGRPDLVANLFAPVTALQSFNFGLPVTYFQGFGVAQTEYPFWQLGLYVQDDWKVKENLTLSLGLRYDWEDQADRVNVASAGPPFQFETGAPSDHNNFGPRVGFAYDPFNQARTVIRGGYGIFYQPLFQSLAYTSRVLSGQIAQVFLPLTGLPGFPQTSADVYQGFLRTGVVNESTLADLNIPVGATPQVVFPSDPHLQNPYSHHFSLGLEQELTPDMSLSLDYIGNRGVHLVRIRDLNVNQIGADQFVLPGLDPSFLQVNTIETSGSSIYHGFSASLRKRFSRGYSMRLAYTLGKSIDDVADFTVPLEPHNHANLRGQRSLSTFDQRHRFVYSAIFRSPYQWASGNTIFQNLISGWNAAPIVTWSSGRPFTLFLGFDSNGDGHAEDRPRLQNGDLVGRNTGRGPSFFSTDFRLSRRFPLAGESNHLEFIIEAFNLFNNVNYTGVNNFVGSLPLGTSRAEGTNTIPANRPLGFTSASDPRQLQLGLRLQF